jgi:tetratricopeptide (TPR) repeat protein
MSDQNLAQTQPSSPEPVQEAPVYPAPPAKKGRIWAWILGGLGAIILIALAGGLGGYYAGLSDRLALEDNRRDVEASTQFQLGMAEMTAGNYDMAKKRFQYVIELNPSYPGVLENMAKLTIIMNATATPTIAPTSTAAPTLDVSGVEALLVQSKQLLVASDWNGTMNALDTLRQQNISFKTLEVDGLYYLALRNRGLQKISNGNLEGGIYDFAVMRLYGPQDKDTADMEQWAKLYISAGRYFGWDWANAVKYFGELYQNFPTLMDSSHRTVSDRYRESLAKYADVLSAKDRWCDAQGYYEQSLAIAQDNKVTEAYNKAVNKCLASQPTATPTFDPSTIPTEVVTDVPPTDVVPTEVTPEITAEVTP